MKIGPAILWPLIIGCANNASEKEHPIAQPPQAQVPADHVESSVQYLNGTGQHPTSEEIATDVRTLTNYRYVPGSDPDRDPDSLARSLAHRIVTAINASVSYDLDELLEKTTATESSDLTCFTFGYDCGGTKGFIEHAIVTWKDRQGRTRAFNLSQYIDCRFTEIHVLSDELFLLIGNTKGSGGCHLHAAYVIGVDPNGLNAEYAAFDTRPYLYFCNTRFAYDKIDHMLYTVDGAYEGSENLRDQMSDESQYHRFSTDGMEQGTWFQTMATDHLEQGAIRLMFRNGRFWPGREE